jgi:hypothetical protein
MTGRRRLVEWQGSRKGQRQVRNSQQDKMLPFVGSYVEIKGEMFQRSGIRAIVVGQIKKADDTKSQRT